MFIKKIIKKICPVQYEKARMFYYRKRNEHYWKKQIRRLNQCDNSGKPRIFYLGITARPNLGDMAQHYCIKKWIKEFFPEYELYLFESDVTLAFNCKFLYDLKRIITRKDFIVFQSGYTTQDLGGNHNEMHCRCIEIIPDASILMMPQTVFFRNHENELETGRRCDKAKSMLFLARDRISFEHAREMLPHVTVMLYPDIVTTLIGTRKFNSPRRGILICRRTDGEKLYSEDELGSLKNKLSVLDEVSIADTSIKVNARKLRSQIEVYLDRILEEYSGYKLIITDRYHGTIFSLIAGTPVIVLKTTDHKVVTGTDWFKGIYDDHVFLAKDLDDAESIAKQIYQKEMSYELAPYFKEHYYDLLKERALEVFRKNGTV